MKIRKRMAIFLSLIMVVSLITGCGSSDNNVTTKIDVKEDDITTSEEITTSDENVTTELSSDEETSKEQESTEKNSDDEVTTVEESSSEEETTTEEETTKKEDSTTTKKQEPTTTKKQEPTTTKKQEPTTTKKQESTTTKKQEPTTTKKQEPTTTKKQEPTTTKQDPTTTTTKQDPTTTKQEFSNEEETTTSSESVDPPITNHYDGYRIDKELILEAYESGDISELCANDRAVYKVVVPLINSIKKTYSTDFEREKAVHDWLVLNASYDYDKYLAGALDDWDYHPYGVLVMKTGVCQSYAEAFDLCMAMLGIESEIVTGQAGDPLGPHAWNAVKLDDEWYQVDVTWDDPVPDVPGKVIYSYFNVTDAVMKKDHEYTYHNACNGTKYNYENMLNQEYMNLPNYKDSLDEFFAYINERIAAGDIEIEVYVTTDYSSYKQHYDFSRIDYNLSPHRPKLIRYGFRMPEVMTSNIWKMTYYLELQ